MHDKLIRLNENGYEQYTKSSQNLKRPHFYLPAHIAQQFVCGLAAVWSQNVVNLQGVLVRGTAVVLKLGPDQRSLIQLLNKLVA